MTTPYAKVKAILTNRPSFRHLGDGLYFNRATGETESLPDLIRELPVRQKNQLIKLKMI